MVKIEKKLEIRSGPQFLNSTINGNFGLEGGPNLTTSVINRLNAVLHPSSGTKLVSVKSGLQWMSLSFTNQISSYEASGVHSPKPALC